MNLFQSPNDIEKGYAVNDQFQSQPQQEQYIDRFHLTTQQAS